MFNIAQKTPPDNNFALKIAPALIYIQEERETIKKVKSYEQLVFTNGRKKLTPNNLIDNEKIGDPKTSIGASIVPTEFYQLIEYR